MRPHFCSRCRWLDAPSQRARERLVYSVLIMNVNSHYKKQVSCYLGCRQAEETGVTSGSFCRDLRNNLANIIEIVQL